MSNYEEKMSTRVIDAISSLKRKAESHVKSEGDPKVDLMSIVKKLTRNRERGSKEE